MSVCSSLTSEWASLSSLIPPHHPESRVMRDPFPLPRALQNSTMPASSSPALTSSLASSQPQKRTSSLAARPTSCPSPGRPPPPPGATPPPKPTVSCLSRASPVSAPCPRSSSYLECFQESPPGRPPRWPCGVPASLPPPARHQLRY